MAFCLKEVFKTKEALWLIYQALTYQALVYLLANAKNILLCIILSNTL